MWAVEFSIGQVEIIEVHARGRARRMGILQVQYSKTQLDDLMELFQGV